MRRSNFPIIFDFHPWIRLFPRAFCTAPGSLQLNHCGGFIAGDPLPRGGPLSGEFQGVTGPAFIPPLLSGAAPALFQGAKSGCAPITRRNLRDRSSTMKNSAFPIPLRKTIGLGDLLENPVFSNIVRLFIIVILTLGGYIWKTEMDHVNKALEEIKASVNENVRRQWREVNQIKREVSLVNREVGQILLRTNQMLFEILKDRSAIHSIAPKQEAKAVAKTALGKAPNLDRSETP